MAILIYLCIGVIVSLASYFVQPEYFEEKSAQETAVILAVSSIIWFPVGIYFFILWIVKTNKGEKDE